MVKNQEKFTTPLPQFQKPPLPKPLWSSNNRSIFGWMIRGCKWCMGTWDIWVDVFSLSVRDAIRCVFKIHRGGISKLMSLSKNRFMAFLFSFLSRKWLFSILRCSLLSLDVLKLLHSEFCWFSSWEKGTASRRESQSRFFRVSALCYSETRRVERRRRVKGEQFGRSSTSERGGEFKKWTVLSPPYTPLTFSSRSLKLIKT